jgi:5-methylcytosine-specific restriction endonuclease McrA
LTILETLAKASTYCPYCGTELGWIKARVDRSDIPTLDRIDNENEVRIDNIEIICNRCNRAKGNMTKNEFIQFCRMVSDKFESF